MKKTALLGVVLLTAALLGGIVCFADAYDAQDTDDGLQSVPFISYEIDADGKLTSNDDSIDEYIVVTGTDDIWGSASSISWYVVVGNVTIDGHITVNGDVNLILTDGSSLTAEYITVDQGNSISIYGQSGGTGKLILEKGSTVAALGGGYDHNSGDITIHGGDIRAISTSSGAGIGGGRGGMGTVTVYDGKVYAQSESDAAIGGGHGAAGHVNIYGGEVTAFLDSVDSGAAIGNGSGSGAGDADVSIYGGTIVAESYTSAGIGGAYLNGGSYSVLICGGSIHAVSSTGAGIGGGNAGSQGSVIITGGTVYSESGSGAGIGGGSDSDGGAVSIAGGTVTAVSKHAAGIGAGSYDRDGAEVTVSGGVVRATGYADYSDIGGTGGSDGSFSTGSDGNAVIFADVIGALDPDSADLSAIVFQNGVGSIYGDSIAPVMSFDLEDDTLHIGDGQTLIMNDGVAITGSGGRIVSDGATGTVMFDGGTIADGILDDGVKRKIVTDIDVEMNRLVFFVGDTAEVQVMVFDVFGDPVSAGSVRIEAGAFTGDAVLVNGACTFSFICESEGPVSVSVSYAENSSGNITYTACSETVAIEVSVVNTDDTVSDDDDPSQIYVAGAIFVILLAILIAVQVLANRKA